MMTKYIFFRKKQIIIEHWNRLFFTKNFMKIISQKYDVHLQNHIDSLRLMMKTFQHRLSLTGKNF